MQKDNLIKITDLRHELHMHPELSMEEKETAERLRSFLRNNTGFKVIDRGSWFYALKEGKGSGRKIAFRADMDALPIAEDDTLSYHSRNAGVSHKCGHDGHCAALCGLALELDKIETAADICLIFQPGEEIGEGAVFCRGKDFPRKRAGGGEESFGDSCPDDPARRRTDRGPVRRDASVHCHGHQARDRRFRDLARRRRTLHDPSRGEGEQDEAGRGADPQVC